MANTNNGRLFGLLKRKKKSQQEVADALNQSRRTVNIKLKNQDLFTNGENKKIAKFLKMDFMEFLTELYG